MNQRLRSRRPQRVRSQHQSSRLLECRNQGKFCPRRLQRCSWGCYRWCPRSCCPILLLLMQSKNYHLWQEVLLGHPIHHKTCRIHCRCLPMCLQYFRFGLEYKLPIQGHWTWMWLFESCFLSQCLQYLRIQQDRLREMRPRSRIAGYHSPCTSYCFHKVPMSGCTRNLGQGSLRWWWR